MRARWWSLLSSLAVLAAAADARATPAEDDARRTLVDKLLDEAGRSSHPYALRGRFGRQALTELAPLLVAHADDAELRHLEGQAWCAVSEERGPTVVAAEAARNCETALLASRRLPGGAAHEQDIAVELGILYSRQGRFAEAVAEYDRALALHALAGPYPGGRDPMEHPFGRGALVYANSAEILMALGQLDEAVSRYRAACEQSPSDELRLAALPFFGLAVALDRDGQVEASRAALTQALARDPDGADLDDPNVFFIPDGEKHYYRALVQLHRGRADLAADELRLYLGNAPPPRFRKRAEDHLARLPRR